MLKTRLRKLLISTSNLREQVGSLYLLQSLPSSFLLLQFLILYFSKNLLCEEQTVFNESFFFLSCLPRWELLLAFFVFLSFQVLALWTTGLLGLLALPLLVLLDVCLWISNIYVYICHFLFKRILARNGESNLLILFWFY